MVVPRGSDEQSQHSQDDLTLRLGNPCPHEPLLAIASGGVGLLGIEPCCLLKSPTRPSSNSTNDAMIKSHPVWRYVRVKSATSTNENIQCALIFRPHLQGSGVRAAKRAVVGTRPDPTLGRTMCELSSWGRSFKTEYESREFGGCVVRHYLGCRRDLSDPTRWECLRGRAWAVPIPCLQSKMARRREMRKAKKAEDLPSRGIVCLWLRRCGDDSRPVIALLDARAV